MLLWWSLDLVTVIVTVEVVDVGRNNVNSSWICQKWQLES